MLRSWTALQHMITGMSTDRGATAVEYGLMVALVAGVIIAAVTLLGTNLNTLFNNIANAI
jgi:pilus assembly protein Flp/PilA